MAQTPVARVAVLALAVAIGSVTAPGVATAQDADFPTAKVFQALALAPGATACEMGADAADRVGAGGHVYSSEMDDNVGKLRDKVSASRRAQIAVVTAGVDRTNFPDGACDVVFMRKVYHHIDTPAVMNRSIAAALKPG